MTARATFLPLLLAPAAIGAALPLLIAGGQTVPLLAAIALLLVVAFILWPWAVLPASIVGGAAVSTVTGLVSVSGVVGVHGGVLAAGLIALCVRRLIAPLAPRHRGAADIPMALLAAFVALGSLYGVAIGNKTHGALVAGYEAGVIPAYFWLATVTLADRVARERAMSLFLVGAVALAAAGLVTPGRHGGLLSALALVPTLIAASRSDRFGVRWTLLGCAAPLGVDVALGAYRSVWLATGVALLVVAVWGERSARRTILAALVLSASLALASLAVSSAIPSRLAVVNVQLGATAGYRLPEAEVGLHAFTAAPLLGAGMGQTSHSIYIPNFRVEDVGPVYHVFYVTVLANGGVFLAIALALAMLPALRALLARRDRDALPWAALLLGFLFAAAFAGPTDGHWELGLLPALTLLEGDRRRLRGRSLLAVPAALSGSAPVGAPASASPRMRVRRPHIQEPQRGHGGHLPGTHAVVVTYNSREHIAACLEALTDSVERVVVVDNHSCDGTVAFVAERFSSVELITNHRNIGFSCAVNQGLARAQHDTVMLVNPDCVVTPGAAGLLRDHLQADPKVGIVAPRVLDPHGAPVVSVHPFETLATVLASRFGGSLMPVRWRRRVSWGARRAAYSACDPACQAPDTVSVDWASGACLAVRTRLLETLGGLDEGYFMYYEDEELCLRVTRTGARVVYLPAATVRHIGGASSGDPAAVWPSLYASMLLFFARHRSRSLAALRAALVVRAGIGTLMAALRGERSRMLAWWRIGRLATRPALAANGRPR